VEGTACLERKEHGGLGWERFGLCQMTPYTLEVLKGQSKIPGGFGSLGFQGAEAMALWVRDYWGAKELIF